MAKLSLIVFAVSIFQTFIIAHSMLFVDQMHGNETSLHFRSDEEASSKQGIFIML